LFSALITVGQAGYSKLKLWKLLAEKFLHQRQSTEDLLRPHTPNETTENEDIRH